VVSLSLSLSLSPLIKSMQSGNVRKKRENRQESHGTASRESTKERISRLDELLRYLRRYVVGNYLLLSLSCAHSA